MKMFGAKTASSPGELAVEEYRARVERLEAEGLTTSDAQAVVDAEDTPVSRSIRAAVRNPLLQLPAVLKLAALPVESQAAIRELLLEIRADARARAEIAWRKHKAPMACYWKAVGVYANHASRLLKRG